MSIAVNAAGLLIGAGVVRSVRRARSVDCYRLGPPGSRSRDHARCGATGDG